MSKRSRPSGWSKGERNRYSDNFVGRLIPLLESPAYRALSLAAHRVLSRIEIELGHHGGQDNGKLPVTYKQFVDYGVDRHAIAPALSELEALGFIEITKHWPSGDSFKWINWFRLTYRPAEGVPSDGSHEWRRIADAGTAEAIAKQARATGRNPGLRRSKALERKGHGEPAPSSANPSGSTGLEPYGKNYFSVGENHTDLGGGKPPRQVLKALNPLERNGDGEHAPPPAKSAISTDSVLTDGKVGSGGKTHTPSRSRVKTARTGPMEVRAVNWPETAPETASRPSFGVGGSILARFRRRCPVCNASTKGQRSSARFCSAACRQAASYRRRKTQQERSWR